MVQRGKLPEPITATHLANLKPLKHVGGKMSEAKCKDPAFAKYLGECCNGSRVWGDHGADTYVDDKRKEWAVFCCGGCKSPLPLPPSQPPPAAASPVTLTHAQIARIGANREAALARKRAREEEEAAVAPSLPLLSDNDWSENGELRPVSSGCQ